MQDIHIWSTAKLLIELNGYMTHPACQLIVGEWRAIGFRNMSLNKRMLCAFAMMLSALLAGRITLAAIRFGENSLSFTGYGGLIFWPCILAGIAVGLLILPSFITDYGTDKPKYVRAGFGGFLALIIAIPIAFISIFGAVGFTTGLKWIPAMGFFIPLAIPVGIIGAIITQRIWWRMGYMSSIEDDPK